MTTSARNRLSKIAPPRLRAPVARERLFAKLDERTRFPVIWVSGPPGSGKTTLVASYLAARKVRAHWYQVDAGDSDPASLFLYLGELAKGFGTKRGAVPLPYFTPEYRDDLAGFARRFFREFFGRMRAGDVLVLDNLHECAGTPVEEILREACAELPPGHGLIGVSRTEAPSSLARWRAGGALLELDWTQIRLTAQESEALVEAAGVRGADASALHCQADGWAAGLMLLAANARRAEVPEGWLDLGARESVFAYFAGEVFDRAPEAVRDLLMCTSLFPETTPEMAAAITGNPDAGRILEGLYRSHYFTSRKGQPQLAYQYHDLFRQFLLEKLEALSDAAYVTAKQRAAAQILSQFERHDAAALLLAGAGDWEGLVRLLDRVGSRMLEQGRSRTLLRWLEAVPEEATGRLPWLLYWEAMAKAQVAAHEAVPMFERVLACFELAEDGPGQLASFCGLVESEYYRFYDFSKFAKWLPKMRHLVETFPFEADSPMELRAVTALLVLVHHCRPDPGFVSELTQRAIGALERGDHPPLLRAEAGTLVLLTRMFQGHVEDGYRLVAQLDRAAASALLPPFLSAHSLWARALHDTLRGDFDKAILRAAEAADICRREGLRTLLQTVLAALVIAETNAGRSESDTESHCAEFESVTDESNAQHVLYRACVRLFRRGLDTPEEFRRELVQDFERSAAGSHGVTSQLLSRVWRAVLVARSDQPEAAQAMVEGAAAAIAGTEFSRLDFLVDLAQAHVAFAKGDSAGARPSAEAFFRKAARNPGAGVLVWSRSLLPDLVAYAWEHGIETACASEWVQKYRLAPPRGTEHWPWPIRIGVLGGFRLESSDGGEVFKAGKKPPHRLLDLLGALVCLGPEVTAGRLGEALWPDAEGDQVQSNLSASVHRLRKLLGRDDAIVSREGRLSVNPGVCWVDALAFERLSADVADQPRAPEGDVLVRAERALGLYRGSLLPGEFANWSVEIRERLRARHLRLALALGGAYEAAGYADKAIAAYERLTGMEPASELAYRHLMRVLGREGRVAEARDVYQRCRRMLSSMLSVLPSAETVAVFEALGQGTPPFAGHLQPDR